MFKDGKSWDVCITNYEKCTIEKTALKKVHWSYLVVDEAHKIKNENTLVSTSLGETAVISPFKIVQKKRKGALKRVHWSSHVVDEAQ